jgi:hypothetical protein
VKSFAIGGNDHEFIRIAVLGYECAPSGEYYDDNWLRCEVNVRAGAFRGEFSASLLTFELMDLVDGLGKLHQELNGSYEFQALDGQLQINASCDALGHIHVVCEAWDQAGIGNKIAFNLAVDQTFLGRTLQELAEVVRAFPVRT